MSNTESIQPEVLLDPAQADSLPPPPPRERLWPAVASWKHVAVLMALLITIAMAFCNSYQSGMTLDNKYIIEEYYKTVAKMNATPDPAWQNAPEWNMRTWEQVGLFFTQDYWWPKGISGLYRPITSFTYWLDYAILTGKAPRYDRVTGAMITKATGGNVSPQYQGKPLSQVPWKDYAMADGLLDMTSYHTINLIVHWINAILIYFVMLSVFKRVLPAAFVALLFAAHPITTETVTNVIGRADMFAATAIFGGLLLHIRATRNHDSWAMPWFVGLALITAFGVFSKESAAAIVLVMMAYDATFRWRKENDELAGLPGLVIHGFAYLGMIGALIGLPLAVSYLARHATDFGMPSIVKNVFPAIASMPMALQIVIASAALLTGAVLYGVLYHADRYNRLLSLGAVLVATLLASALLPYFPVLLSLAVVVFELYRSSITTDNPRYRIISHAIYYLPLYFGLIALPISALWFFHSKGWDVVPFHTGDWIWWWLRYPTAAMLLALGLFAHFVTIGQPKPIRAAALLAVATLAVGASFFSYWMGILLAVIVAVHEILLGSFTSRDPAYRRDWRLIFNGFSMSYLAMIPALLAMFVVRAWLFSTTTPPEEPFLDNPIRGMWKVAELGMSSFDAELQQKPMLGMSFPECKMTAVKVMGKLFYLLAWPQTLCSDYSFDEFPNFSFRFAHGWEDVKAVLALGWMILFFVVVPILTYKRNKPLFFMCLFFFVAALPTSNLTITIGSVMAERFMYLPLAGFTGAVVIAVFWLAGKMWTWMKEREPGSFNWQSALAGTFLAMVVCVYGVRAYFRNFIWISDLTLWNDAIQTSTRAFRCYQSLAFALYEQDQFRNIDKMIALDEQGIRLVDGLPNHLNSSRMYLHLGMYYQLKGIQLCQTGPNGTYSTTTAAVPWFEKSAAILERGAQVDRAFNELNHTKQRLRGDPPWKINDVGLTPVYGSLGESYMRIGQFELAEQRLTYQRQMDPFDIGAYSNLALSQLSRGKYQDACVTLIETIFLDQSNVRAWTTLDQIYRQQFAAQGGATAIIQTGPQVKLNENHQLVREHLVLAYRDLIRIFRRSHRWEMAKAVLKPAVEGYKFDKSIFEPLFKEPIEIVTPNGVQHGQYDPELLNFEQ